MAEIAFERGGVALEATRGTAITAPTYYTTGTMTIDPKQERFIPNESRGVLAANTRSKVVRQNSEWTEEGGLDTDYTHVLFNRVLCGNITTPTTPASGVLTRLWTFPREMTADAIESATLWGFDPNIQQLRAAYAMAEEMTITGDASSTDGVTYTVKGTAAFCTKVSTPAYPAQTLGDVLVPANAQLWIDTSSAIGTTLISNRVVSYEITLPTGVTYKYLANGTLDSLSFTSTGRTKTSPTIKIQFEVPDMTQYDLMTGDTLVKLRLRQNGDVIETVAGPLTYRRYVQIDTWGKLDMDSWGELEGSNRTMNLMLTSQYDATAGTDLIGYVQNTKTAL